jgi:dTDP-4-amino-4,6-dideoxygalactose transaminase
LHLRKVLRRRSRPSRRSIGRLDPPSAAVDDSREPSSAARRERAARYRTGLEKIAGVGVVAESPGSTPVYHLMIIRVPAERRDAIRDGLGKQGVSTAIHYPTPIHRQHAYAQLDKGVGSCPVAERAAQEMISLPMYPALALADVDRVVDAIGKPIWSELPRSP